MREQQDGFTPVYDSVAREYGLVGAAVYGVVHRHCLMRDGDCHCSLDTMAYLLGVTESTARRWLRRLEADGWIRQTQASTPRVPAHYVCNRVPPEGLHRNTLRDSGTALG